MLTKYIEFNCMAQEIEDVSNPLLFITKKKAVVDLHQYFDQDILEYFI